MRVRFNGLYQTVKTGCAPCGHKVKSGKRFMAQRSFILPSGMDRTFRLGQEYEVSEADGNFLLSYSQVDKDGLRQDAFTRVD